MLRRIRQFVLFASLLLAVAFAAAWVRSYWVRDIVDAGNGARHTYSIAHRGRLNWVFAHRRPLNSTASPFRFNWNQYTEPSLDPLSFDRDRLVGIGPFELGAVSDADSSLFGVIIPHWFFIALLLAPAAWWLALQRRRLSARRCTACEKIIPRRQPTCPACASPPRAADRSALRAFDVRWALRIAYAIPALAALCWLSLPLLLQPHEAWSPNWSAMNFAPTTGLHGFWDFRAQDYIQSARAYITALLIFISAWLAIFAWFYVSLVAIRNRGRSPLAWLSALASASAFAGLALSGLLPTLMDLRRGEYPYASWNWLPEEPRMLRMGYASLIVACIFAPMITLTLLTRGRTKRNTLAAMIRYPAILAGVCLVVSTTIFIIEVTNESNRIYFGPWERELGALTGIQSAAAALLGLGACALAARRIRPLAASSRCPSCGYDLRASGANCPECGEAIAPIAVKA